VRDKYGLEYYRELGRKGGMSVRGKHGIGHYVQIGRKGGEQTKAKYGAEHYARIGKLGGKAHGRAQEQGMHLLHRIASKADATSA
jgi:uncharacterized protein